MRNDWALPGRVTPRQPMQNPRCQGRTAQAGNKPQKRAGLPTRWMRQNPHTVAGGGVIRRDKPLSHPAIDGEQVCQGRELSWLAAGSPLEGIAICLRVSSPRSKTSTPPLSWAM